MTYPSHREEMPRQTVQILVQSDSDRDGLEQILAERYDIVSDETLQPVDCYLIGDRMVPAYRDTLRERKRTAHPTFVPVLVLQREESRGTVPLPAEQSGDGPPLIDEVVSAPAEQRTLIRRVENLLARREQSVDLSERYEDVQVRFQRLFDATNDATFVVAPATAEITECNPAACELMGYTRERLRSLTPTEVIHPDDRDRFRSFLRTVRETGEGWTDELTCQTRTGEQRQLEVSAATIGDTDQSQIILSARDVTERKEYERELELKSLAMDEAPIGITISDPEQEDNPMIYVNDGFEAVTGYPEEDAVGRNCRFLQGEGTQEEPIAEMRAAIDAAEPVSVELRNYRKDGSQFWNRVTIAPVRDGTGTVTNYIGFQEDVTERKDREQELKLFAKAVENTGRSVLITNRDGTIEYVNSAFEAQSGYTREEAVGRTPRILKSSKQTASFYEDLWETLLAGEHWEGHIINQRKNGQLYHVDMGVAPITNGSGEITHFVAVQSDVSERRLRNQQLKVLNRVLRHNLRNGTTVIEGRARILRDALDDEELENHVRVIEERTATLSRLSDEARTVSSLFDSESSTETTCDVTQSLTEVVEEVSETYPEATVTVQDSGPVHVRADSRLKIALRELLENAILHNDQPRPAVTVTTRPSDGARSGEWVDIVISDNGPGIPEHEQATIETAEETPLQHSTGFGLWIVYWTVSLFGGEVSIRDNEPRGTRVVLLLPRGSN
jgi:PAS domain S-box-containing protein